MMGVRRPRKMKNRRTSSGHRKRLNPMTSVEKVGRLKEAAQKIEEFERKKKS